MHICTTKQHQCHLSTTFRNHGDGNKTTRTTRKTNNGKTDSEVVDLLSEIDADDDERRINFSVALSPKTTRTRNIKPKQ